MNFTFKTPEVQTKYNYLSAFYKKTYYKYVKGRYTDDRRIFINVYRQLVRMLLVLDTVYRKSCTLDVGANEKFSEEMELLEKIKTKFEELEKV